MLDKRALGKLCLHWASVLVRGSHLPLSTAVAHHKVEEDVKTVHMEGEEWKGWPSNLKPVF